MKRRIWTMVFGLLPLASACGPEGREVETDEALAMRYLEAICDAMAGCTCRDPSYSESDACLDALTERWNEGQAIAMQRGWNFDRQCTESRIAEIEAKACLNVSEQNDAGLFAEFEYCPMSHGTAAAGDPCTRAFGTRMIDCDVGLFCEGSSETCIAYEDLGRILGPGETCVAENGFSTGSCDIRMGLLCDFSDSGTCVVPYARGERCDNPYLCDVHSWCDDRSEPAAPTCVARKPLGEPCEQPIECEGLECFDTCVPREPQACEADVYF